MNRQRALTEQAVADPVESSGTVVSLHARQDDPSQDFLRLVDSRLDDAVAELMQIWHTDLAEHRPVDVLADKDLPELLKALSASGKRIRPTMCFWGWMAAGGRQGSKGLDDVVQVSVALELLHVFALIHDDVMDESDSRRGQPSVHTLTAQLHLHARARGNAQRFGESIAVLVGDLAHAEADHLIATLPPAMRRIWRLLVIELVHGQSRDLTGTAAGRRDLAHARQVARMKSGAYTVQRPLELGAAGADVSAEAGAAISRFGREVGEAFALRDDLLGVWGDPFLTGKPAGDDLLSGKPTVILALAHDRLTGSARAALGRVGTPALSPADVTHLQDALKADGVVDAVESRISAHVHDAVRALDHHEIDPQGVAGLTQMANRIAWRDR
ncbi:MAG TPA: polyprenyl synthetase family protein [Propionibacteriaceae bacterium]